MQAEEKELIKILSDQEFHGRRIVVSEEQSYALNGDVKIYYVANVEVKDPELVASEERTSYVEEQLALLAVAPTDLLLGLDMTLGMNTVSFTTKKLPNYEIQDVIKAAKKVAAVLDEIEGMKG